MSWAYRILAALVLLGGAFAAGWLSRPPKIETKTEVITKVEQVEVEKEVVREVKVVESKPDGTTTTTTTTESTKDTKTTSETRGKDKTTKPAPVAAVAAQPSYSLGVQWRPDFSDPSWQTTTITAGYRVAGPLWVEAGYDLGQKAVVVGARVEL
jgi:hypothetical protein